MILRDALLALGIVVLLNAVIFGTVAFDDRGVPAHRLVGPIPGWVIGLVWCVIFTLMGGAHGAMRAAGGIEATRAARAIRIFIAAAALYPLYTRGLRDETIGLIGLIATALLALWAAIPIARVRRAALVAPGAAILWLTIAGLSYVPVR